LPLQKAPEKASFCEQKEAKNFVSLGRAGFTATGPQGAKNHFFQKAARR
jgi:hypothetical protein